MADSSFDIVSKIDRQEVDNALGQAAREIATRFDFKGTGASIEWQGDHAIEITASADDRASAVPLKSKRVAISRAACPSALSTSWRSILLTMSNDESAMGSPPVAAVAAFFSLRRCCAILSPQHASGQAGGWKLRQVARAANGSGL